ncbi:unnamed protein product [Bathycoccus prasinos]
MTTTKRRYAFCGVAHIARRKDDATPICILLSSTTVGFKHNNFTSWSPIKASSKFAPVKFAPS